MTDTTDGKEVVRRMIDEVSFFTIDGGIAGAWGIEDNESRKAQLGIDI